jgi:hypothetical protein
MKTIEKLGIKAIEIKEFNYNITKDPVYVVHPNKVRKLEKQRDEMFEAIISVLKGGLGINESYSAFVRLQKSVENKMERYKGAY